MTYFEEDPQFIYVVIGDAAVVKLSSAGEEVWVTDQLEDTILKDIELELEFGNPFEIEEETPALGLVAVGYEYSTRQEEGCS